MDVVNIRFVLKLVFVVSLNEGLNSQVYADQASNLNLIDQEDTPNQIFEEDVTFRLMRKPEEGNGIPVSIFNTTEYLRSVFKIGMPTKLIVHGWLSSETSYIVKHTTKVYLENQEGNFIACDWSDLASWKIYPLAALNVAAVGHIIAAMIDKLIESEVTSLDKIHLIGHSLGSHVMGIAGSNIKSGKVSRITGLDPAKPGFEHIVYEHQRLDPTDAEFVDVIHSAAGAAGFYYPIGHADFYPNGGTPPQPGCFEEINAPLKVGQTFFKKVVFCSHGRSNEYFSESIENPKGFRSVECDSWSSFSNGNCANHTVAYMGDAVSHSAKGVFYLETNAVYPYAKG